MLVREDPGGQQPWTHAGALEAQGGGGSLSNIVSNSLVCCKFA